LQRAGVTTGVDLPRLLAVGEWLQQRLGRTLPGMLLKAGNFPPAQQAA
jgi:hydroxymethylglutaryl-CoA lyase